MRQNYDQPIKFQINYATGEIDGFTQGTNTYWYRKNQQGDVTGIFSINYGNTALFVEYEYDAWGNVISITGTGASTIGQTNPIRYRGYYYDAETGFYHLGSRYYDPVTHRFINADGYVSTGQGVNGTNMFAYCNNNPVNGIDPNGEYSIDPEEYRKMKEQYGKDAADGWARDAMAYMNAAEGKHALDMDESRHYYEEESSENPAPDFSSSCYTTDNWFYNNGHQYQCTWYCYGRTLELTGQKMSTYSAVSWPRTISYGEVNNKIRSLSIAVFKGKNGLNPNGHVTFIEKWDPITRMVTYSEANIDGMHFNGINTVSYEDFIKRYSVRNLELVTYIWL